MTFTFEPVEDDASFEDDASSKPSVNKALVLVALGGDRPYVLDTDVHSSLADFFDEVPGPIRCVDENLEHGLWVVCVTVVDDGSSDWPGTREHVLAFRDPTPPTEEEWKRFLDGEHIWGTGAAAPAGAGA